MTDLTEADVRALLDRECREAGSQAKWCASKAINPSYVSFVLAGLRKPGPRVCRALALERVVRYRRMEAPTA